jgi:hypothetical protein
LWCKINYTTQQNGIVWFLRTKLAKALLWHVVFRVTRSNGVRVRLTPSVPLVVADLAPDTFKNAPSLPSHTLAFMESFVSVYSTRFPFLKCLIALVLRHAGSTPEGCRGTAPQYHTHAGLSNCNSMTTQD